MLSALIKCNIGFYDEFLSVATFGFLSLNAWTSKLFVVSNWLAIYFSPKYGFLSKLLVKKSICKLAFCQCDVLRGKIIVIYTRFYYSLPRLQIFHNFKALINYLRFRIAQVLPGKCESGISSLMGANKNLTPKVLSPTPSPTPSSNPRVTISSPLLYTYS